mmetsp:Transcript_23986/g.31862  ORF Transcript_23986/g.31862 Transcript_23986/m.31862 type:complete len:153 (-) Transcript_23986:583-1041(-)
MVRALLLIDGCCGGAVVGWFDGSVLRDSCMDGTSDGFIDFVIDGCIIVGGGVGVSMENGDVITAGCTNGDSVGSINGNNVKNGAGVCCIDGIGTGFALSDLVAFFFEKRSEAVKMIVISPTMITIPTNNSNRFCFLRTINSDFVANVSVASA